MNVNYQEPDPAIASAFPYALADNDRNRMVFSSGYRAGRDAARKEAEAERDALQARLDAMTVEWHTTRSVNGTGSRTQVRSVTPWTVVPEGDTNA